MAKEIKRPPPARRRPASAAEPRHRSGAVARMLHMPVATLRIWERRYALTQPALSPSGQRLYSAADVRRLAMLKQLTDLGHAIGSLATLDTAQLQEVAATHAGALGGNLATPATLGIAAPARPWTVVLIGPLLGPRLQRPALLKQLRRPALVLGPFENVAQAADALHGRAVDAVVFHEPLLHPGWLEALLKALPGLADIPKAVLFGFASEAVCETLAEAGVSLLREPQTDTVLGQWLHHLAAANRAPWQAPQGPLQPGAAVAPPRWDDAALAAFAALSSTIACECPRQVAELLMQLSRFEAYSAQCSQRNAADAQLHVYLQQVAAASRASFESALEQVAVYEGLISPGR